MPEPDTYEGTILEAHVHALASCTVAWGFPSDVYVRQAAIVNCAAIGIDYIAVLAGVLEDNEVPDTLPDAVAMPPDWRLIDSAMTTARWRVVDHIANCIHGLRAAGAMPREGVLSSGEPCNARGTRLEDDDEGTTYA